MKKKSPPVFNLDKDEQELSDSFDRGEWVSVDNLEEEKAKARKIASNTMRKDARINIRITSSDLERLKQMAAYEGLPYQTYIASILHKVSAGHFKN
jgi:predicted DNA binding CopG/RHH family protein